VTLNHVSHKTFTLSTPKGSGTASRRFVILVARRFVSWLTLVTCKIPCPEHSEGLRHRESFAAAGRCLRFTLRYPKGRRERVSGPVSKARQLGFEKFCDTGGLCLRDILRAGNAR
jgi:hypothetical protein